MINAKTERKRRFQGAWMTDIDDTIVPSGVMPDQEWVDWLTKKLRCLKDHDIAWVPMTGVAIDKLAPRILGRLPDDVCSHIIYYGGDGSQKYQFDITDRIWKEVLEYRRVLTDAQTLAILGDAAFPDACSGTADRAERRRREARRILMDGGFTSEIGILGEMHGILEQHGYNPSDAETYFRGGSISWMMLGDVSVDPYQTDEAIATRAQLLEYGKRRLEEERFLKRFGKEDVHIPFHGSRGIKFVLRNNDKERGTRDLMSREGIRPEEILFTGNELFDGGNDHVITNVEGITLVSVGEKTDFGPNIIDGGRGIAAHDELMESVCTSLDGESSWLSVIARVRAGEYVWS